VTFETNDNYSIQIEISNNCSTIWFDLKRKNIIRTALVLTIWPCSFTNLNSWHLVVCIFWHGMLLRFINSGCDVCFEECAGRKEATQRGSATEQVWHGHYGRR